MLRVLSLVVLLGLLTDAHPSHSASWSSLPSLAEGRFGVSAASLDGRVFVLGGFSSQTLANASVWDPVALSWSEAAPMSQPRVLGAAVSSGSAIFALGGFQDGMPIASCERFDPASGSWSAIAPMALARGAFGAAWTGGTLVVAGGQGVDNVPLAECFRYDPGSNAWTPIAALPTPRSGVAVAALEGVVWVIGGMDAQPLAVVERLDGNGQWSAGPSLPEPLWYPAAAAFDGRVWVAGGMDASFQQSPRVYSAGADGAWRGEESLPAALATGGMATAGNCLAFIGGLDASGMPSAAGFQQCVEAPPPPPPPPPPPADTILVAVSLSPSTLEPSSQGQWISARIEPSRGSARSIVMESVRLAGVAMDFSAPCSADDAELSCKFPRSGFQSLPAGEQRLPLEGRMEDGTPIRGEGVVVVHGSSLVSNKNRALRPLSASEGRGVLIHLDQPEALKLEAIDLQGRRIEVLVDGVLPAGDHRWDWPRATGSIQRGTYFMRLRRSVGVESVRLSVLR